MPSCWQPEVRICTLVMLAMLAARPSTALAWLIQPVSTAALAPSPPVPIEPPLLITTEEMPPKVMNTPKGVVGYGALRVHQLLQDAGIRYQMIVLPWARAYRTALTDPYSCVFSAARTPEREALFQWVGPTVQTDYSFYGLAERDYQIGQLADAKAYRIGSYIGDSRAEMLQKEGFQLQLIPDDRMNPQMLIKGRIDLWATNSGLANYLLAQQQLTERITPVFVFSRELLYLACHKDLPPTMISRMQTALDQMRQDGRYDAFELSQVSDIKQ